MNRSPQLGFTLIELLVVIAIIGILSAIVLASLNVARTKGGDAAVKANLDTVRVQGGLYYDRNSNKYNNSGVAVTDANCGNIFAVNTMLNETTIKAALTAAYDANGEERFTCNIDAVGANYAIVAPLKTTDTFWCIDTTGAALDRHNNGSLYTGRLTGPAPALTNGTDYTCN